MNEIFSNELSQYTFHTSVRGELIAPESLPVVRLRVSDTLTFTGDGTDLTVIPIEDEVTTVGKYMARIPYAQTQGNRYAELTYSYELTGYGQISKTDIVEIKTRLISFEDFMYLMDEELLPERFDEYNIAEQGAREVIYAYCNQDFNVWEGEIELKGNENLIFLPKHMSSLTSVKEIDDWGQFRITSEYVLDPTGMSLTRKERDKSTAQKKFLVSGTWGYVSLPDAVKRAAFELTRDFSSSAINNRRQFLLNTAGGGVTAVQQEADMISWRAYADSTGNSIADMYLKPYRIFTPSVI